MIQSYLIILFITVQCITLQVSAKGFSESYTTNLVNGRVVNLNDRLVYVSFGPGTINLTSSDADFVPCLLNVDKDRTQKYELGGALLGNGKIIAWNHGFELNSDVKYWKIFIVDPVNCTSRTVSRIQKGGTSMSTINTVIPYYDNFDVFSHSNKCSPCRFKDNGEPIELPVSIYKPLNLTVNSEHYDIQPIGGNNVTSGYIFMQEIGECKSLLKILGPTFEVLKEQTVDGNIKAISTDNDQIRICSNSHCLADDAKFSCQVLDFNLRSEKSVEKITDKAVLKNTFLKLVQNLPDGGAIVAFVNQEGCFRGDGEGSFGDTFVKRIRADGHVDSNIQFDFVSCWHYDFQNFLMRDGKYCLVAYDGITTGTYPYTQTVLIKCLKYDE